MIVGGPPQQDTRNMSEEEKKRYKAIRKVCTDGLRMERLKRVVGDTLPSDNFTGCLHPVLRTEVEVEAMRLEVGHSFTSKDKLFLRIAEEANLRGIEIHTTRSNTLAVARCHGRIVRVDANHSELYGWRVTVCNTRHGHGDDMVNRVLDLEVEEEDPDCVIVPKSPYRTPWLKDLLRDTIAETPSASNQVLRQQLSPDGKPYALTDTLIQAARTQLRFAIFGDPEENCQYVHHVVKALQAEGHIVELRMAVVA
jgi:hypothetical protein